MTRLRPATAHWALLAVAGLTLFLALLLQGFTDQQLGRAGTGGPAARKGSVAGGAALLYRDHGALRSRSLPPRTVALTFDDGPDPRWTPQVLDVLERAGVPGTFFAVGSRAVGQGELVRRVQRDGSEVGLHTWTHADLPRSAGWRARLEVQLDQLATIGVTGHRTRWIRPPYSSTPAGLTGPDVTAAERLTASGYLVALSDRDSEDWRRPGVPSIVENALPAGDRGAVVLFHDGGGDRGQTVAALPQVIERLKARGYRFTTLSQGLGLPAQAAAAPASGLRRAQGYALVVAVTLARAV